MTDYQIAVNLYFAAKKAIHHWDMQLDGATDIKWCHCMQRRLTALDVRNNSLQLMKRGK